MGVILVSGLRFILMFLEILPFKTDKCSMAEYEIQGVMSYDAPNLKSADRKSVV